MNSITISDIMMTPLLACSCALKHSEDGFFFLSKISLNKFRKCSIQLNASVGSGHFENANPALYNTNHSLVLNLATSCTALSSVCWDASHENTAFLLTHTY